MSDDIQIQSRYVWHSPDFSVIEYELAAVANDGTLMEVRYVVEDYRLTKLSRDWAERELLAAVKWRNKLLMDRQNETKQKTSDYDGDDA